MPKKFVDGVLPPPKKMPRPQVRRLIASASAVLQLGKILKEDISGGIEVRRLITLCSFANRTIRLGLTCRRWWQRHVCGELLDNKN